MVKKPASLPLDPLADLMRWWQAHHVRGVVIGGLAVAFLGRPRVTRDIDVLVLLSEDRWSEFLAAGTPFGFLARIPEPLVYARTVRMLLLRHQPTGIDLDVSLGLLPFEKEVVDRAKPVDIGGLSVPVATPEDLVVMKTIAGREQDQRDVDGLLAAHPGLNKKRVLRLVRAFGEVLDTPDLLTNLEQKLKRIARKPRKGK